jgi:hypothetical protein
VPYWRGQNSSWGKGKSGKLKKLCSFESSPSPGDRARARTVGSIFFSY